MSTTEKHKNGKPWKVILRTKDFNLADSKRKNLLAEKPETEVKVKFLRSHEVFVVKIREE